MKPILISLDINLDKHTDCPIDLADFGSCGGQTFLPFLKLVIGKYSYFNYRYFIVTQF